MRGRLQASPRAAAGGAAALVLVGLLLLMIGLPSSRAASPPGARTNAVQCSDASVSVFGLASGQKLVSDTDVPVCVTGQLTVTFAGDQAAGCAGEGLCAYSGTETWDPQGPGDVNILTLSRRGHRFTNALLALGGLASPVRAAVRRLGAGGSITACSDHPKIRGGFFALTVHGGHADVGLGHAQPATFGTRCAGPLDVDVAGALPHRLVSLARLRQGHLTIDLSGSGPFAAGGFAGTVQSTVMLALGRPRKRTGTQHVTPPPGSTPIRLTSVEYRITHLGGAATATVRAAGAPAACGPFDACGLQGTIAIAPRAGPGGLASVTASAPHLRSERDLLTALGLRTGGDAAGISVFGAGEAATGGTVTADLTQDGSACTDDVALQHTAITLRKRAGRLTISLSPEQSQAADPLRTRCPGPALGRHPLTTASLPLSVLRRPRFTVKLHGDSFHNGPYAVTTRSTLTVSLERGRVKTQILPFVSASRPGLTR
jgi:hypothetical protein